MKTRLSALAAAVSSLFMLTACGGGGGSGGDGSVPEYTPPYYPSWSTSEGAWTGTVGTGGSARALAGVVTADNQYWLGYSTVANHSIPAGFYAGASDASSGTFNSSDLREFNFESGGAKAGKAAAQYLDNVDMKLGDTSKLFLNGSFDPVALSKIEMHGSKFFPDANGDLIFDMTGTYDPTAVKVWDRGTPANPSDDVSFTGLATMSGRVQVVGFVTTLNYKQMIMAMEPATGKGFMFKPDPTYITNCTREGYPVSDPGNSCPGLSSKLQGFAYNAIHFSVNTDGSGNQSDASTGTPFTFAPGSYTWTMVMKVLNNTTLLTEVFDYPLTVTVTGAPPPLPLITQATFTTAYDSSYNYDATPSLSAIAGSYTASPAYTGIGSTMRTNTTTFTISSGGVISGAESVTGCAYSGTIDVNKVGKLTPKNVYAVTNLTFTGGSCPYTSSGAFTGKATYKSGKLTLTATNTARDKGFMVVVSKP